MEFKATTNKRNIFAAVAMASTLFISHNTMADDDDNVEYMANCQNLPLVSSLINGKPNTDVCVDAPVALEEAKVVFDMNSDTVDAKGRHTGLRHMYMIGKALQARVNRDLMEADEIQVIGVLHGSGLKLAMEATASSTTKYYIEEIFKLKNAGIDLNLEVCGVSMHGKGLNNSHLYKSDNGVIHVNQGAIGRIINLQQKEYVLVKE